MTEYGMTTEIRSREDLPFVSLNADGKWQPWDPLHDLDTHSEAIQYGLACAAAMAQLARVDAQAAQLAVRQALMSEVWTTDCGEEEGFIDALAQAAVAGWRAMPAPLPGGIDERQVAQWTALNSRLAQMEEKLESLVPAGRRRRAGGLEAG
jgi:hypothetical protein